MEKIFDLYRTSPSYLMDDISEMLGRKHGFPMEVKMEKLPDGSILIRKYDARAEKRKKWVERFNQEALVHCAKIKILGHSTAVSYRNYYGAVHLGISHCSPKDEYDKDTGIAVAMAKAMNQPIPGYI